MRAGLRKPMKVVLAILLAARSGWQCAARMLDRLTWDDATAMERYQAGTMSAEEKRFRGYYPYHNGPFA